MARRDTSIKPVDKRELNLILCEVLKAGWSVEELAKLIQRVNEAKAPELPNGEDFSVKVLTDAIITIGHQQSGLVERIENLLAVKVSMTHVGFSIFSPPLSERPLSNYAGGARS